MIYGRPDIKLIYDEEVKQRHPLKDKVKSYEWFPSKNILIAITEVRNKDKLDSTLLYFFEIPSRKQMSVISLPNLEVVSFEWHQTNTILLILCKVTNKAEWICKILEFNYDKFSYKSKSYDLIKQEKKKVNNNLNQNLSEINYLSTIAKWMGDTLIVVPKYKENNLDTINLMPYKFDRKTLNLEFWGNDKMLKELKHSDFIPSCRGSHFVVACMDSNSYIYNNKIRTQTLMENLIFTPFTITPFISRISLSFLSNYLKWNGIRAEDFFVLN